MNGWSAARPSLPPPLHPRLPSSFFFCLPAYLSVAWTSQYLPIAKPVAYFPTPPIDRYWEDEYSVNTTHIHWEPTGFLSKIDLHRPCYEPRKVRGVAACLGSPRPAASAAVLEVRKLCLPASSCPPHRT